jgi:hypothetical protein
MLGLADNEVVEKTTRVFQSFVEMKAAEYRYWQSRPAHERMGAVSAMSLAAYDRKGLEPRVPRLQRTYCPPSTPGALSTWLWVVMRYPLASGRMRDLADVESLRESQQACGGMPLVDHPGPEPR